MIQQILNGNNSNQKPVEQTQQPTEVKAKKVDTQQVVQGFAEYMMGRRRADAEAIFALQDQFKTANNQLIDEVCKGLEQQIVHLQSVVSQLRKTIQ